MSDPTPALISVIMPLYNSAEYLDRSVRSVLEQTFPRLELILVDDGSTDQSGAMCDAYAARDRRVRVIHQANGGVCAARNAGLRAAGGDYIAWLDSDDRYAPTMLQRMAESLSALDAEAAMCNYYNVTGSERALRHPNITRDRRFTRQELLPCVLTRRASPVLWCTLMPRRVYEGVAFPEGVTFEDIRVTYRLYERLESVAVLAEPLVERIHRDDSLSRLPDLSVRVDNLSGYIERYEDAVNRWPQCRRAMLVSDARMLPKLRGYILRASPREFAQQREGIRQVHRHFRAHRREILAGCDSLRHRLLYGFEFDCMTSGSRALLRLSQAFDDLIRRPESSLRKIPIPDVKPFES